MGSFRTVGGANHAFLWRSGVITDLGSLAPDLSSCALGIDNLGQVVRYSGHSTYLDGQIVRVRWHAFYWDPVGGMRDLGCLNESDTWAYDVNDAGQILGRDLGQDQAFV